MRLHVVSLLGILALAACGGGVWGEGAPTTTLSPPPGPFNDEVTVTFTTDVPATVFVTTDGSDVRNEKGTRVSGASPFKLTLKQSTTVNYYSSNGSDEIPHSVQYVRAGAKKGTISGVIVVDTVALGKAIQLDADSDNQSFAPVTTRTEIPFHVDNLQTGTHRLQAIADRDGDGQFIPLLDISSQAASFDIDLGDPFKASVENVRLDLGASDDGLCSIVGNVKVPNAQPGEVVRLSVLDPSAFLSIAQGGGNPTNLLAQLQNGDQLLLSADNDTYPYAITNLQPGAYIPVPALTSLGLGGLGLNFQYNLLQAARCAPDAVIHRNFTFGPNALTGTVSMAAASQGGGSGSGNGGSGGGNGGGGFPGLPGLGNFTYGIVAVKHTELLGDSQAVLMPVIFMPDQNDATKLTGNFTAHGFTSNTQYDAKVFTSLDPQNPIAGALIWVLNPAGGAGTVKLNFVNGDLSQDISL